MSDYTLSLQGQAALKGLFAAIGHNNGVENVAKKFNLTPSVEQKFESKVRESDEFLQGVNIIPVPEKSGQVIGLGTNDLIAGRVSRANLPRRPKNHANWASRSYQLATTLFDSWMEWELIDMWAKFKNFPDLYSEHVARSVALSRICAGFNGVEVADDTNLEENPLLEDVNIGWLQKMRLEKPDHVFGRAIVTTGVGDDAVSTATGAAEPIQIGGAGADFENLDALVYDMISQMPSFARNVPGMVAIVSSDLLDDKYLPMINRPLAPTIDGGRSTSDETVREVVNSARYLGGKPAMVAPYFPEGTVLVTPLASAPGKMDSNLSIYYQEGSRRRYIKDEPENMASLVDYNSVNEGYVIENTDRAVLAENITFGPPE